MARRPSVIFNEINQLGITKIPKGKRKMSSIIQNTLKTLMADLKEARANLKNIKSEARLAKIAVRDVVKKQKAELKPLEAANRVAERAVNTGQKAVDRITSKIFTEKEKIQKKSED